MIRTRGTRTLALAGLVPAGKLSHAATLATALAGVLLSAMLATPLARAQTFNTLHSFSSTDGAQPINTLVQATDGNIYGAVVVGGANGGGTIFKITPTGALTTLYNFCSESGCTDGSQPQTRLVQAVNGDFYGVAYSGGAHGAGTIFKITPSGTLTTLYSFCSRYIINVGCTDGQGPNALLQATNGKFYGGTYAGGANGYGTVFEVTPSGRLTTLYGFCSQANCSDGANPTTGMIQATNGNIYGTTYWGGRGGFSGNGTIFEITPSGTHTTLYSFCSQSNCSDGAHPNAGVVQATSGDLYGTTYGGGANNVGGTVFTIAPGGTLSTLYRFCSKTDCPDGSNPYATVIQATDGNFYGATGSGGAHGGGAAFKITPSGKLTALRSFCAQSGCTDGETPWFGELLQDTNGEIYGTTYYGGTSGACSGGCGRIFSLSVGLGPFVETQPASGKVGAAVNILGTNLTGTTSVTFNGTVAVFDVVSSSLITTTVPTGATTGRVEVTTPSGTLTSSVFLPGEAIKGALLTPGPGSAHRECP